MKKNDATRVRLDEIERQKLEAISKVTGLPISTCIRALISAFVKDFEKNKGKLFFPISMNASLRIWSAIQKEYVLPACVNSVEELSAFLQLMENLTDKV